MPSGWQAVQGVRRRRSSFGFPSHHPLWRGTGVLPLLRFPGGKAFLPSATALTLQGQRVKVSRLPQFPDPQDCYLETAGRSQGHRRHQPYAPDGCDPSPVWKTGSGPRFPISPETGTMPFRRAEWTNKKHVFEPKNCILTLLVQG